MTTVVMRNALVSLLKSPTLHAALSTVSSPIIPFYDRPQVRRSQGRRPSPVEVHKNDPNSQLLFGIHPVLLALTAGKRQIFKIFIKDSIYGEDRASVRARNPPLHAILEWADRTRLTKQIVNGRFLSDLVNDRPHQGVCLETSAIPMPVLTQQVVGHLPDSSICLLLDQIKDVMNFSSILRTAAFFSVSRVLLPAVASCAPLPIVSKISSGAMEEIDFYRMTASKLEAVHWLRQRGCLLVGTSVTDGVDLHQVTLPTDHPTRPLVLVLGSEDLGVTPEVLGQCDFSINIPGSQGSSIASLNVSVACGIILHTLYNLKHTHNRCK